MFIALDKLANQKLKQAIIVVPEKTNGASFHDEPLSQFGSGPSGRSSLASGITIARWPRQQLAAAIEAAVSEHPHCGGVATTTTLSHTINVQGRLAALKAVDRALIGGPEGRHAAAGRKEKSATERTHRDDAELVHAPTNRAD